jgi:phosphinothricin acetyltransferase
MHPSSVGSCVGRLRVRPARESDLGFLTELYNHYVAGSPATFDVRPFSTDERRAWFVHYAESGPHRLLVAEWEDAPVGYSCSSSFRPKPAYETSVETTVYVAPGFEGRGIGSALYAKLFDALRAEDLHRAYAGVTLPNPASVALHRRFGFQEAGLHHEVGRKFGRYWSVQWFEKRLGEAGSAEAAQDVQDP